MRRRFVLVALLSGACGRSDFELEGAWIVGRYHAVVPDEDTALVVGQYVFTADRRFVVRFEYCDDTPALTGDDPWIGREDGTVLIGPTEPARSLSFPILDVRDAIARPADDGMVEVQLRTREGPGGLVRLRPGLRCIGRDFCGPGNVFACDDE